MSKVFFWKGFSCCGYRNYSMRGLYQDTDPLMVHGKRKYATRSWSSERSVSAYFKVVYQSSARITI